MEVLIPAQALLFVPLVIALTSLAKIYVESKYAPLISLGFGFLCAWFIPVESSAQYVLHALVLGLTASGLYSQTKSVIQNVGTEV